MNRNVMTGLAAAGLVASGLALGAAGPAGAQSVHRELAEFTQQIDGGDTLIFRGRYYPNAPVYGVVMVCLEALNHGEDSDEVIVYSAGGMRQGLKTDSCLFIASDYVSIQSDRDRRSAEIRVRLIETGAANNTRPETPPAEDGPQD